MDRTRSGRRRFLKAGAAFAAFAGLAAAGRPASGQGPQPGASGAGLDARHGSLNLATEPRAYGHPSRFARILRKPVPALPSSELHGDLRGTEARSPIGELTGEITPSALHYVESHGNVPPE